MGDLSISVGQSPLVRAVESHAAFKKLNAYSPNPKQSCLTKKETRSAEWGARAERWIIEDCATASRRVDGTFSTFNQRKIPARRDSPAGACEDYRNVFNILNSTTRRPAAIARAYIVHKNLLMKINPMRCPIIKPLPNCLGQGRKVGPTEAVNQLPTRNIAP
jgi:hypothetical protein